jgi:hypothetical protein
MVANMRGYAETLPRIHSLAPCHPPFPRSPRSRECMLPGPAHTRESVLWLPWMLHIVCLDPVCGFVAAGCCSEIDSRGECRRRSLRWAFAIVSRTRYIAALTPRTMMAALNRCRIVPWAVAVSFPKVAARSLETFAKGKTRMAVTSASACRGR